MYGAKKYPRAVQAVSLFYIFHSYGNSDYVQLPLSQGEGFRIQGEYVSRRTEWIYLA